jgi:hypothetical protein
MELRLRLLHPTSIAAAFLLTDHVLLLRGIHGERTGAWVTRKDQGGVAHDSARGHALLHRLKAVGMCPPSLPAVSFLCARPNQQSAATELLILEVAGAEGGQAPRGRAWVGTWRPPSRAAMEASSRSRSRSRRGAARRGGATAEAAKRGKQRRTQAFDREEIQAHDRAFGGEGWGSTRSRRARDPGRRCSVKTPSYNPSSHVSLASRNGAPTSPSVVTRGLSVGRGGAFCKFHTL